MVKQPKSQFGRLVREWRLAHDPPLTQVDLAKLLHVSQQAMSNVENGAYPGRDLLHALAKLMGTTMEDLIKRGGLDQQPTTTELEAEGVPAGWLRQLERLENRLSIQDRLDLIRRARQLAEGAQERPPQGGPPRRKPVTPEENP